MHRCCDLFGCNHYFSAGSCIVVCWIHRINHHFIHSPRLLLPQAIQAGWLELEALCCSVLGGLRIPGHVDLLDIQHQATIINKQPAYHSESRYT